MHIVQLSTGYPPSTGGVYRNTRQCAVHLAREHRVTVLVPNQERRTVRERMEGVDVVRVSALGNFRSQFVAPGLVAELRRLRPDVVHLHAPNPLGVLAYLMVTPRTPLLVTHHADVVRQRILKHVALPMYREALRRADGVIFYTRSFAEGCTDARGVEGKSVVIPMGFPPESFEETPEDTARAEALRRRLAGDAPTISFVGRLVYYKGLEVLLRALVQLPAAHAMIGGQGPLRPVLEKQARELGIADRVHFLGYLDERSKLDLYRAGDVFVLPSINQVEAFAQTQVEAQFCRRPIVASRLPGPAEVTQDGVTGIVVPPGEAAPLADALGRLLADAGLRRRMGEAGYQRAFTHYNEHVVGERLRDFVRGMEERVASRSGKGRRATSVLGAAAASAAID